MDRLGASFAVSSAAVTVVPTSDRGVVLVGLGEFTADATAAGEPESDGSGDPVFTRGARLPMLPVMAGTDEALTPTGSPRARPFPPRARDGRGLDGPDDLDDLAVLAGRIAGVPTVLISLDGPEGPHLAAAVGLDPSAPLLDGIAVHDGVEHEEPDAGLAGIACFARFPLVLENGSTAGALCVIGRERTRWDDGQRQGLRTVARQISAALDLRATRVNRDQEVRLRRAAEAQLAWSRREPRLVLEDGVVCRYRADGTLTHVSATVGSLLGPDRIRVVDVLADAFVHPDEHAAFAGARSVAAAGGTTSVTVRCRHVEGSWRWLELTLTPAEAGASSVDSRSGQTQVTGRDVTETVRVQAQLTTAQRRLRTIHHDSPVGIVLSDEDGWIIEVNPAVCRLVGREEQDIVGRARDGFGLAEDAEPAAATWFKAKAVTGDAIQMRRRIRRIDGDIRWVLIDAAAVEGPTGQRWSLAHIRDITALVAAEQIASRDSCTLEALTRILQGPAAGEQPRQSVVAAARHLTGGDSTCLVEQSGHGGPGGLVVTAAAGLLRPRRDHPVEPTSSAVAVWESGLPRFVARALDYPLAVSGLQPRPLLWQPVVSRGQVIAVLAVTWERDTETLPPEATTAFTLLAAQAALVLNASS